MTSTTKRELEEAFIHLAQKAVDLKKEAVSSFDDNSKFFTTIGKSIGYMEAVEELRNFFESKEREFLINAA